MDITWHRVAIVTPDTDTQRLQIQLYMMTSLNENIYTRGNTVYACDTW